MSLLKVGSVEILWANILPVGDSGLHHLSLKTYFIFDTIVTCAGVISHSQDVFNIQLLSFSNFFISKVANVT